MTPQRGGDGRWANASLVAGLITKMMLDTALV
jgi:hypothetical protein